MTGEKLPPLKFHVPLPLEMQEKQATPSMDDLDLVHLNENQSRQVRQMLRTYDAMWDESLAEINTGKHHIDLT